jgi:hypothetical protein
MNHPISRRDAIKLGLAGAASLCAPHTLSAATRLPTKAAARSVIQIWMWGGPAHLDTFDPKPDAGHDYTGPFKNPLATNVPGIRIGEHLPMLAKMADSYSIIRSMTHGINGHETASYRVQTGYEPGRLVRPCLGALVSKMKGVDHGYKGLVPPYIVLTRPQGRFSEQGFLGPDYRPFATGGDPNRDVFAVEGIVSPGITDDRQRKRRRLLEQLDTFGQTLPNDPELAAFDKAGDQAYETMFGDARKLFDLKTEPDTMRDAYGRNTFGQSCLMARRLVEHGVPYITINYNGWDTHKGHFPIMKRKLPEMDRAMATLLTDLKARGLLDSTVLWWSGEFGRSPKIQWNSPWNGGRSHFGSCFSGLLAGGGFKGGHLVGASDEKGLNVAERPVLPENLLGSICQRMGIDPLAPLANPHGLDLRVMEGVDAGDGRLKEIM